MINRLIAAIAGLGLCLPGAALADWRDEIGSFRVALAASADAQLMALQIEPFRLALEQALGMPVEIVTMRDYPAIIDAAARSRIEYAVLSASAHAAAYARCECVEPIVTATTSAGAAHYRQILITREGGPGDLKALQERSIAVVEGSAVGGRMLAEHELRKAGLDLGGAGIKLVAFQDSASAAAALAEGSVDALLGWNSAPSEAASPDLPGTLRQALQAGGANAPGYTVLWQSSPIPHRVHSVRKNLSGEAKTILRSLLGSLFDTDPLAYDAVEPEFGGGFVVARQSQFDPLTAMFRATGLSMGGQNK